MVTAKEFDCPNCGASLDYRSGDGGLIRCSYCSSSVIIPEELSKAVSPSPREDIHTPAFTAKTQELAELGKLVGTGRKIEAIKKYRQIFDVGLKEAKEAVEKMMRGESVTVTRTSTSSSFETSTTTSSSSRSCLSRLFSLAFTLTLIVLPFLIVGYFIPNNPFATMLEKLNPLSFARVVHTFGEEGIGPGYFTDARYLAVDGEGNIYVGEFGVGRVQVFDPSGEFITQWMLGEDTNLSTFAVNRQGTAYVAVGGKIILYDGLSGELLRTLDYEGSWNVEDIVITGDGGVIAAWDEDIVRFDSQGNVDLVIPSAISTQSGDSELNTLVAVDGLGNIYALGVFHDSVFKFSPQGKFMNRFGSAGDDSGQFRALTTNAIAVDHQGRVYVSDFRGILVFDSDGRYLDRIATSGVVFDMAFNAQNELIVITSNQKVVKYVITE